MMTRNLPDTPSVPRLTDLRPSAHAPLAMPQVRKVGFTLIELLVVVAIISTLAALLVPALAKARQSALTLTCLSQTKQQSVAVLMYADDAGDELVPAKIGGNKWTTPRGYYTLLIEGYLPYARTYKSDYPAGDELRSEVLLCPAVTNLKPWLDWTTLQGQRMVNFRNRHGSAIVGPPDGQLELLMFWRTSQVGIDERVMTSYALNGGIVGFPFMEDPPFPSYQWNNGQPPKSRKLGAITKPENTWMLSDFGPGTAERGMETPAWRHGSMGCNFASFDGHAETLKPRDVDVRNGTGADTIWGVQKLGDVRLRATQ